MKYILAVCMAFMFLPILFGQSPTEDFVLLNIEDLDRTEIGLKLQEVNKANPKMVAVNVFFGSDRGESDDALEKAFKETENLILGYTLKDKRLGSHAKFTPHAADSGMTRLVGDVRMWPMYFVPYQTKWDKDHRHFSMTVASNLVEELPDYKHDGIKAIDYSERINYTVINLSELDLNKHDDLIENNVVIVGYLGPDEEAKQFTPLREGLGLADEEKDTYGTEVLVYMIKTILDESK